MERKGETPLHPRWPWLITPGCYIRRTNEQKDKEEEDYLNYTKRACNNTCGITQSWAGISLGIEPGIQSNIKPTPRSWSFLGKFTFSFPGFDKTWYLAYLAAASSGCLNNCNVVVVWYQPVSDDTGKKIKSHGLLTCYGENQSQRNTSAVTSRLLNKQNRKISKSTQRLKQILSTNTLFSIGRQYLHLRWSPLIRKHAFIIEHFCFSS